MLEKATRWFNAMSAPADTPLTECRGTLNAQSWHGQAMHRYTKHLVIIDGPWDAPCEKLEQVKALNDVSLQLVLNAQSPQAFIVQFGGRIIFARQMLKVSFSPGRDRIRRHCWISSLWTPWENG